MNDLDLSRRLRMLRRAVLMLQTELRNDHIDEALVQEIDQQMERGIGTEARCALLPAAVDALRESAMSTRTAMLRDTIRACEKLKDAIDEVLSRLE